MKKLVIILLMTVTTTVFAQDKNKKATLEVDGVCGMCKARIEKASYQTKGVKSANWDVQTHELKLIFDERKTNIDSIQKNIAAAGHDTKAIKATNEAYNKVNACCKYRDPHVHEAHKN
ncbi:MULTISPECIES: heavy-metal-associated domain-containing protein [Mesoflavibacter]|uniref:Heavy-metal-associated domain-containing protein n=1 Tax=Mesoflavibacter profundi TaxID=2708110 RepID=A0ABT4RXF5_9FLAO|nr:MULTISPECIES: heavy-metal-associated domain-containing protein [Mesoflavibacter]MDA0176241.1 heavy-metal-associated domain-containing protein [Mesoflavibacter profundi]QIJ89877.1 putative Co/Zn/Cd efflux system membrane fusion protein [Mesoflavibacter sp. HG96]QIJ92605.1 putative Co/Zn/Cd efflux system membrane fusion protein [Mesoflavibacter sp. HG37]